MIKIFSQNFFLYICISFLLLISSIVYYRQKEDHDLFILDTQKCNTEAEILRFSCYRSVIEQYFQQDTQKFATWMHKHPQISFETAKKGGRVSFAVFGTNCHTFYHAAGDYIATYAKDKNIQEMRDMGMSTCTNGYIMALYKRLALQQNFSLLYIKKLNQYCPDDEKYWCAHEMGHLLYDRNIFSILKVLDETSEKYYNLSYPESYKYTTFIDKNIQKAFDDCEEIFLDRKRRAECWSGIGHNLFILSEAIPNSIHSIEKECNRSLHKQDCYQSYFYRMGLNKAAPAFLSEQFQKGNIFCEQGAKGNKNLLDSCYKGLGRGLGLFFNSEYTNAVIQQDRENGIKIIEEYRKLCVHSPKQYRDICETEFLDTKMIRRLRKGMPSV